MKNLIASKLLFGCLLAALFVSLSSCEKDEGKLPAIAFATGAGYTSADATVAKGASVLVGIVASKSENKDVLKTFNVSVSLDSAANTTILNQSLSGSDGDHYETDVPITVRNQAGTEKYTFTVTNRDGLTNQVSLKLTVQ